MTDSDAIKMIAFAVGLKPTTPPEQVVDRINELISDRLCVRTSLKHLQQIIADTEDHVALFLPPKERSE